MSKIQLRENVSVIVIAGRGFGDAIMLEYAIEKMKRIRNDLTIDVLCEPCLKSIFADNELINRVYVSNISISRRTWKVGGLIKHVFSLRKKYDVGIEIIGDFRERFLLKLLAPKRIYGIVRAEKNLYKGFYDFGKCMVTPINIPESVFNFYDCIDYFVMQLLGNANREHNNVYELKKYSKTNFGKQILGIHPFSGLPCKMWQWEKWNMLCDYFLMRNVQIKVFCAPNEESIVKKELTVKGNIEIISGTIQEFKKNLKEVTCLICLDSFSMHMSYMLGVPHVMINGANDYRLWQTRMTHTVFNGNNKCNRWPCWGGHGCKDYKCINNIDLDDVINSTKSIMKI